MGGFLATRPWCERANSLPTALESWGDKIRQAEGLGDLDAKTGMPRRAAGGLAEPHSAAALASERLLFFHSTNRNRLKTLIE